MFFCNICGANKEQMFLRIFMQIYWRLSSIANQSLLIFLGRVLCADFRGMCVRVLLGHSYFSEKKGCYFRCKLSQPLNAISFQHEKKTGEWWLISIQVLESDLPLSKFEAPTLHHMNRQNPSKQSSFSHKQRHMTGYTGKRLCWPPCNFASDSVISKVTQGSACDHA